MEGRARGREVDRAGRAGEGGRRGEIWQGRAER